VSDMGLLSKFVCNALWNWFLSMFEINKFKSKLLLVWPNQWKYDVIATIYIIFTRTQNLYHTEIWIHWNCL